MCSWTMWKLSSSHSPAGPTSSSRSAAAARRACASSRIRRVLSRRARRRGRRRRPRPSTRRCPAATAWARSARCSAPSSSPRSGPVSSSSGASGRREKRRARKGGEVTEANVTRGRRPGTRPPTKHVPSPRRTDVMPKPPIPSDKIGPDDPRYRDLIRRGFNKRFAGKPDYVRVVSSTEQVVDAVQDAVRDALRLAVRSGGHCLEGFVADPAVRVLIDTSLMTGVYHDPEMAAFAVEAGATLGEAYRKLFLGWGVTIPAGESPDIGMGGHVSGGAFGFLCREHGLAADYLYAVEVVVVDEAGTARTVVATREPSDPNRDLWWAHTGGGPGNFGVVTRCWFRSPDASGDDPTQLLPQAPTSVLTFQAEWNWRDIDRARFGRLVRNFGDWTERNSDASSRFAQLYGTLTLNRRQQGTLELTGLTTAMPDPDHLVSEHLDAVND